VQCCKSEVESEAEARLIAGHTEPLIEKGVSLARVVGASFETRCNLLQPQRECEVVTPNNPSPI